GEVWLHASRSTTLSSLNEIKKQNGSSSTITIVWATSSPGTTSTSAISRQKLRHFKLPFHPGEWERAEPASLASPVPENRATFMKSSKTAERFLSLSERQQQSRCTSRGTNRTTLQSCGNSLASADSTSMR